MDLPHSLATFIAAATPIGELRLAIPLAIYTYQMSWLVALPVALAGNILPILILVPSLNGLSKFLLRFPNPLGKLLTWQRERLLRAQSSKFDRYGAWALVVLVAIPLPMTGAWTGSFAAWVFHIPPHRAIPLISLGVLIAGIIVTIITISGAELGKFMLA